MARFSTIHEVPRGLRSVRGVKLTLAQINGLIDEAGQDGPNFAKKFGEAKKRFTETHQVVNDAWIPA